MAECRPWRETKSSEEAPPGTVPIVIDTGKATSITLKSPGIAVAALSLRSFATHSEPIGFTAFLPPDNYFAVDIPPVIVYFLCHVLVHHHHAPMVFCA